jgi:hypothetical protein
MKSRIEMAFLKRTRPESMKCVTLLLFAFSIPKGFRSFEDIDKLSFLFGGISSILRIIGVIGGVDWKSKALHLR